MLLARSECGVSKTPKSGAIPDNGAIHPEIPIRSFFATFCDICGCHRKRYVNIKNVARVCKACLIAEACRVQGYKGDINTPPHDWDPYSPWALKGPPWVDPKKYNNKEIRGEYHSRRRYEKGLINKANDASYRRYAKCKKLGDGIVEFFQSLGKVLTFWL